MILALKIAAVWIVCIAAAIVAWSVAARRFEQFPDMDLVHDWDDRYWDSPIVGGREVTAPFDLARVRVEWATATDTMSRSSREYNLEVFAGRWVEPLLDRIEVLESEALAGRWVEPLLDHIEVLESEARRLRAQVEYFAPYADMIDDLRSGKAWIDHPDGSGPEESA